MPIPQRKVQKQLVTRPVEAEDFFIDKDSASNDAFQQAFGSSKNERDQSTINKHNHDGKNSLPIDIRNLAGLIQTVSAAPSWVPKSLFEQIAVYSSGGVYRLYIYDSQNAAWRYVALT